MKILELFCGLGGWSKGFAELGHECIGIDIKDLGYPYKFIKADLFDWLPKEKYDIVLASPPCTEFSIAKKWGWGTQDERQGLDLIYRTFYLIELIKPKYYIVENVKGLGEFLHPPNHKIRYIRHKAGKWAYLWTNFKEPGFFPEMIQYETHDMTHAKKVKRGLIPIQVSRAYANMI